MKDDKVLGKGYNYSLVDCNPCLKDRINDKSIGKNPAVCTAIHSEWMVLIEALSKWGENAVEGSTLYIVGRYLDGRLWKSKYFACTICSRLLKYCGVKEIVGLQFNKEKTLTMDDAFESSYEHLLGELI